MRAAGCRHKALVTVPPTTYPNPRRPNAPSGRTCRTLRRGRSGSATRGRPSGTRARDRRSHRRDAAREGERERGVRGAVSGLGRHRGEERAPEDRVPARVRPRHRPHHAIMRVMSDDLVRRLIEVSELHGDFVLPRAAGRGVYFDKFLFLTRPDLLRGLAHAVRIYFPIERTTSPRPRRRHLLLAAVSLETRAVGSRPQGAEGLRDDVGRYAPAGARVLIEDVSTTGHQVRRAAEALGQRRDRRAHRARDRPWGAASPNGGLRRRGRGRSVPISNCSRGTPRRASPSRPLASRRRWTSSSWRFHDAATSSIATTITRFRPAMIGTAAARWSASVRSPRQEAQRRWGTAARRRCRSRATGKPPPEWQHRQHPDGEAHVRADRRPRSATRHEGHATIHAPWPAPSAERRARSNNRLACTITGTPTNSISQTGSVSHRGRERNAAASALAAAATSGAPA